MDGQKKPHWGITNPISEAHATPKEDKLNDDLIRTLTAKNVFESPEGTKKRGEVLDHIQKVVLEFIRRVGKQKGLDQSVIDKMGGKIFTFGSYALGVHGPSSDIDAIVVAPKQVTLYDYFQTFEPTFREMSNPEDIEELVPVSDAYVPIIKMEYSGVSIDLIFCSLPKMASIPADMKTIEKHNLEKLDEASMRAVNGPRVKVELLELVPQQNSFKNALRAIKLWANERGIYGNVYGYPGGVAWAIMVARICQLYPYANGATIVSKFFNLMFKWGWPRPVLLKHIEDAEMGLRVWNPQIYHKDRADLMPIITPAFPSMNSTYTITPSTLTILKDELGRASQIMEQVLIGHKQWDALFERHTFFTKDHKYYLSVVATSRSKELNATFSGLVGSKVRLIAKGIDDGQTAIDNARPYVKSFTRLHRCKNEDQIFDVSQGSLSHMIPASEIPEDGTVLPNGDESIVYTTTFYIGLTLPAEGNKSLDISYPVATFKGKIEEAKEYDDKTMCVKVIHTRNTALPDDVFLPGEVRPKKPTKEKKKKDAKSVKRHFAETGLDDSGHSAAKRQQSEAANGLATPTPA